VLNVCEPMPGALPVHVERRSALSRQDVALGSEQVLCDLLGCSLHDLRVRLRNFAAQHSRREFWYHSRPTRRMRAMRAAHRWRTRTFSGPAVWAAYSTAPAAWRSSKGKSLDRMSRPWS